MSSLNYIRHYYKVPAEEGGRILYSPPGEPVIEGTIMGACGASLLVLLDGEARKKIFHPTWRLEYI